MTKPKSYISPRQKFLAQVANVMPRLNSRNLANFAHRLAVEIDAMRGRIFDDLRDSGVQFVRVDERVVYDREREQKLFDANLALYRAHTALLDAQRELSK